MTLFAEQSDTAYSKMKRESYRKKVEIVSLVKKIEVCFKKATSKKEARNCLKKTKKSSKEVRDTFFQVVYNTGEGFGKAKFIWNRGRKKAILDDLKRIGRDSSIYLKCLKRYDNEKDYYKCLKQHSL